MIDLLGKTAISQTGILELSIDEIDAVNGGRRGDAAAILGNLAGGALGIIGGIAVTAVAGPVAGAIAGVFFAGAGSVAATNAFNQIAGDIQVSHNELGHHNHYNITINLD